MFPIWRINYRIDIKETSGTAPETLPPKYVTLGTTPGAFHAVLMPVTSAHLIDRAAPGFGGQVVLTGQLHFRLDSCKDVQDGINEVITIVLLVDVE